MTKRDEFAGIGGSYRIDESGKRVQVEAPTSEHPEGNRARLVHQIPTKPKKPETETKE